MANEVPERVCWDCYCEDSNFAIILEIIAELKKKGISSSFKNILERLHVGQEIPEISEEILGDVLDFAEKNNYIDIKTYKGNTSYKVSDNYLQGDCVTCSESIEDCFLAPSSIKHKNQNINNQYVGIKTFQILSQEVDVLKQSFAEFNECVKLKEKNNYLTLKIQDKDAYIDTLMQVIKNLQCNKESINDNPSPIYSVNKHQWNVVNKKASNNREFTANRNMTLSNKFSVLSEENFDNFNARVYNDDANIITNSHAQKQTTVGINAGTRRHEVNRDSHNKRRPQVVTKNIIDNTTQPITVLGNSSYAKLTNHGKKVCLFGASILQRINIKDFNYTLKDKTAIKECHPGATASRTSHYIKPTLEDENPDVVMLNIGTNNLTKKKWQTDEDIAHEIIQIVGDCRKMGVNEVYVSGLTVRRGFHSRINNINKILQKKAGECFYTFIDNSNIQNHHLRHDGLHLEYEGTCLLADNLIDALNKVSIFNSFY